MRSFLFRGSVSTLDSMCDHSSGREVEMRRICGVLMALLLLAMPLLVADAGVAAEEVEMAMVVWAQDAGPPVVVVSDNDNLVAMGRISAENVYDEPNALQVPARASPVSRYANDAMQDYTGPGPWISVSSADGECDRGEVPAWRDGLRGT